MRLVRIAAVLLVLGLTLQLTDSLTPLHAQSARDTLVLGRRAYERADFAVATSLLPIGLTAGGSRSDSLWVAGVHMLTDALLEQGKDSLAQLWARWATRLTGGFAIDSIAYPPRVIRVLGIARTDALANPADSLVNDAWDEVGPGAGERGVLRIQRGGQGVLAVIEGVGTMLPGESRTVAAGSYRIRLTADGFAPLVITREVLPGYVTIITPRLARPGVQTAGAAVPASGSAPASVAPVIRGTTLAAAAGSACTVLDTGAVICWGNNAAGQLGSGAADSTRRTPVTVRGDVPWAAVSVGGTHTCALTREGRAWCWGLGSSGELGNGQTNSSATPVSVSGGPFVQITAGAVHSCALSAAGAVFCWGANRDDALGNRTSAPSAVPVSVAAPANVSFTAVTAGQRHTCALASNGAAYCWGANGSGQLGNGSTSDANTPVLVASGVPFKAIAAGGSHTCALTPGGSAWCWGSNVSGQLGTGAGTLDNTRPVVVSGALSLSTIAAGDAHTCGLTDDGAAYCWGAGRSGQLGNGQSADVPRPALVVGGHVFRGIALGAAHACATADDRTTWCWGSNGDGQLGGLVARVTATPVPVVVRPVLRTPATGSTAPSSLRETFADGNWTAAPAWSVDSTADLRLAISDSALDVSRTGTRGQAAGAGLTMPVRIPVTRTTQIQFDVMVRQGGMPCGLNCANYPAAVRLRVKNSDLTESEVWYAFGDRGAQNRSFGGVVIVARGDVTAGTWLRGQRFTVRDALPRADTILQLSVGGIGPDFAARFDNILLPLPVATVLDVTPDTVRITAAAPPTRLHAVVRDAGGVEIPGIAIAWQSSDTTIVRVDSTGTVLPVANGRAIIRVRSGALGDSTRVTVKMAPARRPARRPN